jgi:hypothetical protein
VASRLSNLAAYGSLLNKTVRRSKERPTAKGQRQPRETAPEYLVLIRKLPCLACGASPPCDAAHIRMSYRPLGKRPTGLGETPSDRFAVPLDRKCHAAQHNHGDERDWWEAHRINPVLVAKELWEAAPDLEKMRAVVRNNH